MSSGSPVAIARTRALARLGRRHSARVVVWKKLVTRSSGVLALARAQREPGLVLGHQLLERRQQQVLLAAEAAVEGAERDAGVRRDVAQAHGFEAALLGQLDRRLDDASRALFHAAIGTCFTRPVQSAAVAARPGADAARVVACPAFAPVPEAP